MSFLKTFADKNYYDIFELFDKIIPYLVHNLF